LLREDVWKKYVPEVVMRVEEADRMDRVIVSVVEAQGLKAVNFLMTNLPSDRDQFDRLPSCHRLRQK